MTAPLLAASAGLMLSSAAAGAAAKHHKHRHHAAPKVSISVKPVYWLVKINGHSRHVHAGGQVGYCASANVETIGPRDVVSATAAGTHAYQVELVGPKHAGRTAPIEHEFSGKGTSIIDLPMPATAFIGLTVRKNVVHFSPGIYKVEVSQPQPEERPAVVVYKDHIKLVQRSGC